MSLEILQPLHGSTFVGSAANAVQLRGSVDHPAPGSLFYKWYSSLHNPEGISGPADAGNAALNFPQHGFPAALAIDRSLALGSHILTFTAKDIEGDGLADMSAVQEAGMAGGPPEPGVAAPCVVHVFRARIVPPPSPPAPPALRRSGDTLEAEAPLKWGVQQSSNGFARDPDYHEVNRVRYRWRFEPVGGGAAVAALPPLDASEATIAAFQEALVFAVRTADPRIPVVQHTGPLPAALTVGTQYRLVLRVEDSDAPSVGHEASLVVQITS